MTPACGMKDDDGKADLTLIPWDYVARPATAPLIRPLTRWWLRQLSAETCLDEMRGAWRSAGRDLIDDMGEALRYGAVKYAPENWRKGLSSRRLYAAACRHYQAIEDGRRVDAESGLDHHCHLAFYAAAIFAANPDDRVQQ